MVKFSRHVVSLYLKINFSIIKLYEISDKENDINVLRDKLRRYSISEIANMVGIPAQTIRFYEDKGLIQSVRDENSGYRLYSTWELYLLVKARWFRQMGFPLKQIAAILKLDDIDAQYRLLCSQEEDLNRLIELNQLRLDRIREIKLSCETAKKYEADSGAYEIITRRGFYFLSAQKDNRLHMSKEVSQVFQEWVKESFFVDTSGRFSAGKHGSEKRISFEFGLSVDERYASLMNLSKTDTVQYYPSGKYALTWLHTSSENELKYGMLDCVIQSLQKDRFELCGDIFTNTLLMSRPDSSYSNYHCILIPVSEIQ